MDKLTEYIPAILILVFVMIITIIIINKYGDKIFDRDFKFDNVLLLVASFLFMMILIVHLFKEQAWTPDTLKILVGIIVGAGSSRIVMKKNNTNSSANIQDSSIDGDVAGRDMNKSIQNIKDTVSDIKDSVIHQNTQISKTIRDPSENDYIINTIYDRGENITAALKRTIQYWQQDGWTLKHFSSDYNGMDGIYLIFSRPMQGDQPQVRYHHGSRVGRQNE